MIHRIDIPTKNPAHEAAGIVMEMLRREGMDPRKALGNGMVAAICRSVAQGEMNDAGFRRAIGNMLILNPSLRM